MTTAHRRKRRHDSQEDYDRGLAFAAEQLRQWARTIHRRPAPREGGEEGAQESQSANLDGEPEHGALSAVTAGPPEVVSVEVNEPIELLDSGFSAEAAPPSGLQLGEEGDRHAGSCLDVE